MVAASATAILNRIVFSNFVSAARSRTVKSRRKTRKIAALPKHSYPRIFNRVR
jgi:hypothetical protein